MPQSLKTVPQPHIVSDFKTWKNKEEFRKYYLDQKEKGSKKELCLFQGYVYDVSEYKDYHPGGVDRLEPYLGKNIDAIFKAVGHTAAAYKVMAQLPQVGKLEGAENIPQDAFSPKLKEVRDFDTTKGMWWQMMWTEWTLEEYIQYLEEPKLLITPWRTIKLFDNWFLEFITQGPWWMTIVACLPFVYIFFNQSQCETLQETLGAFAFGLVFWTFFEYSLHRFVFHGERYWVPDNQYAIACHFVLNGIHHAYPQDYMRTVFPVLPLAVIMRYFVIAPVRAVVPEYYADAMIAGIILGYCMFEEMHYFTHYGQSSIKYLRRVTRVHMHHHYRGGDMDFGVTTTFWDWLFGTYTKLEPDVKGRSD